MDGTVLALFLAATFVGGIATGLAGFAFGLIVSGVWLHVISPLQTTALIVFYGLFSQSYGIWTVRHSFNWRHALPLVIGSIAGAPIGVWLLHFSNPRYLRLGVGLLLIAYAAYSLRRVKVKSSPANVPVELSVGVANGILGGMSGLAGVIITLWCGMHGWSKDKQRSVYQPVILASFVATAISLLAGGTLTFEFVKLYALGAPALLVGMLLGFKLYGHLDDATFRKVILVLVLLSGSALAAPELLSLG